MADKTPDSVQKVSLGSVNLMIYKFITENIDDNDTLTTGIPSAKMVGWPRCVPSLDGPQDFAVDAVDSAGVLTFGCAANQNGYVEVMYKDM
jgi:hypothetical protein